MGEHRRMNNPDAHVQGQYNIVKLAIELGNLDEAWDLVGQFEEMFLFSHLELCNELSDKIIAIDPNFYGEKKMINQNNIVQIKPELPAIYTPALSLAIQMLETNENLEIRSALKEAGSQNGIQWGDDMQAFVLWAEDLIGV